MKQYPKRYYETHTTTGIPYEIECCKLYTNDRNELYCKKLNVLIYTPGLDLSEQNEKPCWYCVHNQALHEEV